MGVVIITAWRTLVADDDAAGVEPADAGFFFPPFLPPRGFKKKNKIENRKGKAITVRWWRVWLHQFLISCSKPSVVGAPRGPSAVDPSTNNIIIIIIAT